jgi:hypothetical protein
MRPPLDDLLAQYEVYEPALGYALRTSLHLQMLGAGRAQMAHWEASGLYYFSGPANLRAFSALVQTLRPPAAMRAALLKPPSVSQSYYWGWDFTERVEHISVEPSRFELRYSNRKGRYRLEMKTPPLPEAQRATALEWLSQFEAVQALAHGQPRLVEQMTERGLLPSWGECEVGFTSRTAEAAQMGVQFLCRALVIYPAHLLILRGLGGEMILRTFLERQLEQRREAFDAAVRALPANPAEFWAAPELPELPLPHAVVPDPGMGRHLPPADFWVKPADNKLLMDVLAKVYKNVPRKMARLTERRLY